jgi:hypothetical protein
MIAKERVRRAVAISHPIRREIRATRAAKKMISYGVMGEGGEKVPPAYRQE